MSEGTDTKPKITIRRIGGYLHRVVPIADKSGQVLSYVLNPLMVEFRTRDVLQVAVGAALLAIPVSLTEEAWRLGETLPVANTLGILGLVVVLPLMAVALPVALVGVVALGGLLGQGSEFSFLLRRVPEADEA